MQTRRFVRSLYAAGVVATWLAYPLPAAADPASQESVAPLRPDGAHKLEPVGAPLFANACNPCAKTNPCNPCAAKNPCNPCTAANPGNPCAAKNACNPCAKKNPCAAKNPCNPCAMKNPCNPCGSANPCNPCGGASIDPARFKQPAGVRLAGGPTKQLLQRGEQLWTDRDLGNSGIACATCHFDHYGQMNPSFQEPYPHFVAMPHQRAGVDQVSAQEMVQFCMLVPMMSDPLPWQSTDLAALTAYVKHLQKGYRPVATGGNPCNPCAMKNPCNPCAVRNACNPCATKRPVRH